jgi:tripartite-type tricarboxylate transporter receptor subunit TctC
MANLKLPRRQFLRLVAGAAVLPTAARIATAQTYPNRPVRLILPFSAGGATDTVARLIADRISAIWGQQVVVENRGGAGGNIGGQAVVQAAPDGYTILVGSVFLGTNPFLYASLGYDPVADLAPVTLICVFPNLMVVPNSSPAKSVREFIEYARANRGKVSFASSGTGASPHLSGELFKYMAGIEMTHVPYRGGAPVLNDLIPGRVDVYFGNLPGQLPQVRSGTLRGLAVTSATRSPFAPQIPTIAESGLPGYDVTSWYALYMPAKTPPEIVKKAHDDAVAALTHASVKQKIEELGATVAPSTPAELAAHLQSELKKWGPIIKAAGIKGE